MTALESVPDRPLGAHWREAGRGPARNRGGRHLCSWAGNRQVCLATCLDNPCPEASDPDRSITNRQNIGRAWQLNSGIRRIHDLASAGGR
jgi:hypothetical protein